jgi:hypothetical protein
MDIALSVLEPLTVISNGGWDGRLKTPDLGRGRGFFVRTDDKLFGKGPEMNKYGIPETEWQKAKQQARDVMIRRARVRGMIPYSDLLAEVTAISIEPHDLRLSPFLGEISREEHAEGRPLLTAIVTHKTGDMQPGPGFYELAASLGRDTSDLVKCWVEEAKKVHAYWEKKK